jgi:hypothetical protein
VGTDGRRRARPDQQHRARGVVDDVMAGVAQAMRAETAAVYMSYRRPENRWDSEYHVANRTIGT